jgi:hypothetical protein
VSDFPFDPAAISYAPDDPELSAQLALINESYLLFITDAAISIAVAPSLVAGIGSRESHWGRALLPRGPGGTGDFTPRDDERLPPDASGFGRGLMQIDYDEHEFARTGNWADPEANVVYGCGVLRSCLEYMAAHAHLAGEGLVRASVAAYNCGPGTVAADVAAGRDPDTSTAHRNYSRDVVARATWFNAKGID